MLRFFIPHLYQDADFSNGFTFLDKELEQLSRKSRKGAKYVDKLVKVQLKNGEDQWILVHIEVQGYADKEFPERMFRYYYRIYDKYSEKIVSLALITGMDKGISDGRFELEAYGSGILFRYLSPRLMDFDKDELEKSDNPIALIILACQGREEAKKRGEAYNIKLRLIRSLYEKGYTQDEIRAIFDFIDWIITLNDKEEELILEEIKEIEEVKKMPYVGNMERIIRKKAITEGKKEGKKEGIKEGIKEGMLKKSIELLLKTLDERFGKVPSDVTDYVKALKDDEKLNLLHSLAIRCSSIDEFKQSLNGDSQN